MTSSKSNNAVWVLSQIFRSPENLTKRREILKWFCVTINYCALFLILYSALDIQSFKRHSPLTP